jgi:Holliday junction resolvase RusA-like endonuclease
MYYKGRILTKKSQAYRNSVHACLLDGRAERGLVGASDRLAVQLLFYHRGRYLYDVDNPQKPVLDALESAGIFPNDNQIDDLRARRMPPDKKNPRVDVTIEVL